MSSFKRILKKISGSTASPEDKLFGKSAAVLRELILGSKNWNLKAEVLDPLVIRARLMYSIPPVNFEFIKSNTSICQVYLNADRSSSKVEFSSGIVELFFVASFALGRTIRFVGKSGYDSKTVIQSAEVAEWLAPRIDEFYSGKESTCRLPVKWLPKAGNRGIAAQMDFIGCLFRGALRFLLAHEVGHIVLAAGYEQDEVASVNDLAESLPYPIEPEWHEEYVADRIGARLALSAWTERDLPRLNKEVGDVNMNYFGQDLAAYYAGVEFVPEFLWMVEKRAFKNTGQPLFLSHPSATFRKIAIYSAWGKVCVKDPEGTELIFERDKVVQLSNVLKKKLNEIDVLMQKL